MPANNQVVVLQKRDQALLNLLKEQGFATYEQLRRRFFPSKSRCSKRICKLKSAGYIEDISVLDVFFGKDSQVVPYYFPYILGLNINKKTRILRLTKEYKRQFSNTNSLLKRHICIHQLMLNEVRFFLEDNLKGIMLNDPKVKVLSHIDAGYRKEFVPDLSIESKNAKIAIELERTVKSKNRYSSKFYYYMDSIYTHVLYYYIDEKQLKTLVDYAGSSRKFGFSHYKEPNLVLSNTWGYLSLNDFITKVNSISQPNY